MALEPLYVECGSMLRIPKRLIETKSRFNALVSACTVSNPKRIRAIMDKLPQEEIDEIPRKINLWRTDDENLYVPRYADIGVFNEYYDGGDDFFTRVRQKNADPLPTCIKLRDTIQEEAYAALISPRDKIIALACGRGKTVIALKAACDLGLKTLIVTPNGELAEQWIADGILGHFGTTEKTRFIPGIERADIGMIGKGKRKIGERFTIAIINTIALSDWIDDISDEFGLVIFDEVHRYGAEKFHIAASRFSCERWGLSATVSKPDGSDILFRLHIGEITYENLNQDLTAKLVVVSTPYGMDNRGKDYPSVQATTKGRGFLTSFMLRDVGRTDLIACMIVTAYKAGRTQIVLTERKDFIVNSVSLLIKKGVPEDDIGFIFSDKSITPKIKAVAKTKKILIAIRSMVSLGFDRKDKDLWGDFDMVLCTMPVYGENSFNQTRGRVERPYIGKFDPIVVMLADSHTLVRTDVVKAKKIAIKNGMKIEYIKDPDADFGYYLSLQGRAQVCLS